MAIQQSNSLPNSPVDRFSTFRDYISSGEGPSYNVIHGGLELDLTGKTLGEIRELQRTVRNDYGVESSAMGRYQIIGNTLDMLMSQQPDKFNSDFVFDERGQDMLADALIEHRMKIAIKKNGGTDDLDGLIDHTAKQMGLEWAAFPDLTTGLSQHHKVGSNRANKEVGGYRAAIEEFVLAYLRPDLYSKNRILSASLRPDGSVKSPSGFLGPFTNERNQTVTEFSTDLGFPVKEFGPNTLIPLFVPGQSQPAIDFMLSMDENQRFDTSDPFQVNILNTARQHAVTRILDGKSPFYEDFEEYYDIASVTKPYGIFRNTDTEPEDREVTELDKFVSMYLEREEANSLGRVESFATGVTFGLYDEGRALVESMIEPEADYKTEVAKIRKRQAEFALHNPGEALLYEGIGSLPTGYGLGSLLFKAGVKSIPLAGGIDAGFYGFNSGDGIEQRLALGGTGFLFGATFGKLIDLAITPSARGGFKTEADLLADGELPVDPNLANIDIQKARATALFSQVGFDDITSSTKIMSEISKNTKYQKPVGSSDFFDEAGLPRVFGLDNFPDLVDSFQQTPFVWFTQDGKLIFDSDDFMNIPQEYFEGKLGPNASGFDPAEQFVKETGAIRAFWGMAGGVTPDGVGPRAANQATGEAPAFQFDLLDDVPLTTLQIRAIKDFENNIPIMMQDMSIPIALEPNPFMGTRVTQSTSSIANESPDTFPFREVTARQLLEEQIKTLDREVLASTQTFGEFSEALTDTATYFYNDKVTGLDDMLTRKVGPEVGFGYQRSDIKALTTQTKEMQMLVRNMPPIMRMINESGEIKGILLDYGSGQLIPKKELAEYFKMRDKLPEKWRKTAEENMRQKSITKLNELLTFHMNSDQRSVINAYINWSYKKNKALNKPVHGAEFDDGITFLHSALIKELRDKIKAERGIDDTRMTQLFDDPAFETRTRGRYLDPNDPKRPNPGDYENPLISDMQRLFNMERLAQLQSQFAVDVEPALKLKKAKFLQDRGYYDVTDPVSGYTLSEKQMRALEKQADRLVLTTDEFMDAFQDTLNKKGISEEGALFARNAIADNIIGQGQAPHPLVQSANSLSYATTLAGFMSGILNIADVPMIGAKYGGAAVAEGLQVLNPFKSIPSPDLKKMGLDAQVMGEFTDALNLQIANKQGWMARQAELTRKSAEYLMKGSLFTAFDQIGKRGVMRGILKAAVDGVDNGFLERHFGHYFNPVELGMIRNELVQHGIDWRKYSKEGGALIEEMLAGGLGQQQLISGSGRAAAWGRHPNLRPLWALRGFVIKQQALFLREVVDNIKKGNHEEAIKFLGRYALFGAGGYAFINEGRQFVFGDGDMSVSGLMRGYGDAWASILTLNTLGLNDYQYGRIQEAGILQAIIEGLYPLPLSRGYDIASQAVKVLDGDQPVSTLVNETLPIVKQGARGVRNVTPEGSVLNDAADDWLRRNYKSD